MRQRLSNTVWTSVGRRAARHHGLALAAGLLLAGCVLEVPTPDFGNGISHRTEYGFPVDETGAWTQHGATAREKAIAASNFSMELVKFTDARRPRSLEAETPDQIIHQYDPDQLLQGLKFRIPNIMERYLAYKPHQPKNYKLEVELVRLRTLVKTGTLWSGSWGRYSVDMELRVIARRDDSTVVMQRTYHLAEEQPRQSHLGRGPSKERDRARMYDLTESMLRKICEQIGWDLRQRDARVWNPARPAPAGPYKFGLDQANGSQALAVPVATDGGWMMDGSNDSGVEWYDEMPEPVIVPATPVDEAPAPDELAPDELAPDAAPAEDAVPPAGDPMTTGSAEPVEEHGGRGVFPAPAMPLEHNPMGPSKG